MDEIREKREKLEELKSDRTELFEDLSDMFRDLYNQYNQNDRFETQVMEGQLTKMEEEIYELEKFLTSHVVMNPVKSEFIESIGYDVKTETLYIKFNTSFNAFEYHKFSPLMFAEFMNSESKGKYFHQFIKGKFECVEQVDRLTFKQ